MPVKKQSSLQIKCAMRVCYGNVYRKDGGKNISLHYKEKTHIEVI